MDDRLAMKTQMTEDDKRRERQGDKEKKEKLLVHMATGSPGFIHGKIKKLYRDCLQRGTRCPIDLWGCPLVLFLTDAVASKTSTTPT